MDINGLNVVITTTGAPEAVRAFGTVDAAAQKVRDDIRASLGQVNNDLSRVGETLGKNLEASAARSARAIESVATSADLMGTRSARAVQGVTRGLEVMARTGTVSGRSLDQIIAQTSRLALGFGEGGLLVGAIGIGTAAIVEMFNRTRKELEKTQEEFSTRLVEMARSANLAGIEGRYGTATELKSGDPFMRALGRSAFPKLSDTEFLKQSGGIDALNAEQQRLTALVASNHSIFRQGSTDADKLREVTDALTTAQKQYNQALKIGQMVMEQVTAETKPGKSKKEKPDRLDDWLMNEIAKSIPGFHESSITLSPQLRALEMVDDENGLDKLMAKYDPFFKLRKEAKNAELQLREVRVKPAKVTWIPPDQAQANEEWIRYAENVGKQLASTIGDSIGKGFEALFSKGGGLKAGFKALTGSLLEGLGDMFEQAGKHALLGLSFIKGIVDSIASMNPVTGIAAAVGLIALGAAMKSAGASVAASGASGGGASYYGASSSSVHSTSYVNPAAPAAASYSAAGLHSVSPVIVNATIIGKDDPSAQRQLLEMIARAQRRGGTVG